VTFFFPPKFKITWKGKEIEWYHHDSSKIAGAACQISNSMLYKMLQTVGQLLGYLYKVTRRLLWSSQHWLEDVYCFSNYLENYLITLIHLCTGCAALYWLPMSCTYSWKRTSPPQNSVYFQKCVSARNLVTCLSSLFKWTYCHFSWKNHVQNACLHISYIWNERHLE